MVKPVEFLHPEDNPRLIIGTEAVYRQMVYVPKKCSAKEIRRKTLIVGIEDYEHGHISVVDIIGLDHNRESPCTYKYSLDFADICSIQLPPVEELLVNTMLIARQVGAYLVEVAKLSDLTVVEVQERQAHYAKIEFLPFCRKRAKDCKRWLKEMQEEVNSHTLGLKANHV